MSTVNIVVLGLAVVAIVGGTFFALRLGKSAPSVPKTGGQVTGGETTDEETVGKRQGGFAPPSGPAAE